MLSISNNYQNNFIKNGGSKKSSYPSFCSNYTETTDVFNPSVKQTKNATFFFRNDLDWNKFCKIILKNHKPEEKLNIVCVPCSDGSEPTSLLLKLMQFEDFRNNVSNFDCIKAYDIDEKQLDIAKSGKIPLFNDNLFASDVLSLALNAGKDFGKTYNVKDGYLELADNLKDKIKYENKDIIDVVKDLPKDEKVVLLARNIFPYIDNYMQVPRMFEALSQLKSGSILAIGDYDKKLPDFENAILKLGYKKSSTENCFIKI